MKRLRKEPNERGLAAVCQRESCIQLRENGEILTTVAPLRGGCWYCYGLGQNKCDSPCTTMDEAKRKVTESMRNMVSLLKRQLKSREDLYK